MKVDNVIDNEFARIVYYPELGIIHHEWKKFCSGSNFQELMLTSTNYLKEHNGTKWLSDDSNFSVMAQEDKKWGQEIWWPKTKNAGWKYWAIVLPEKVIGKLSIKALIDEYSKGGITAQVFDNTNQALKWLESQK